MVSNTKNSNYKSLTDNEELSSNGSVNKTRPQDKSTNDKVKARALFLSSLSQQGSEEKPLFSLRSKDFDDQALNSFKRSSMVTEL